MGKFVHMWTNSEVLLSGLMLALLSLADSNTTPSGDAEYCELDVFKPSCAQNEVILMKSAFYGRMALGKCITQDYGIGCKADVLPVMDGFCSGRQTCSVIIGSTEFLSVKAKVCPRDGSAYLASAYECIQVLEDNGNCQSSQYSSLTDSNGYIPSSTSSGSPLCPFKIQLAKGIKVNITMLNFPPPPSIDKSSISSSACYEVGLIKEGGKSKTIHKCLNDLRHKQLYLSNGGHVDINIPYKETHEVSGHFLIHYEAIGCSDPNIPDNAELQRNGNKATISCKNSDQAWKLTCNGKIWEGEMGQCTQEVSGWSFLGLFDHDHPYGTAIVVGIGATLGVLTGGTLLYIIIAIFKKCQKSDYVMTYEYADPSFAHIPTDYHADKSNLLLQDDKLFEQNSNTWGSQRHGNSNTLSRGGTDHSRVPLPPLPNENNTLSYEKPLYNRNGNV